MSSFNGWPIVSLPSSPVPKSIEWQFGDTVGSSMSPFSLQKQFYNWNASILKASISYAPMTNAQALPFIVFLMASQGTANIFSFGDPLNTGPQNGSAVAGTVTGSGQAGYTLVTSSSNMTPGDWFSLGLRLYRITSVTGGTLGIWPQLRESPAGGTNLVITNATGLFRLTKNDRKIDVAVSKLYGLTFEIEEAI